MPKRWNDIRNLYNKMNIRFNFVPDRGNELLHFRVALLKIRKLRRDATIPDHELDEIYNIANEALND